MMRFKAVLIRVLKELMRDKRTLALVLIAPMLVLSLMNLVFDTNTDSQLKIGVSDEKTSQLVANLPTDKVEIIEYQSPPNKLKKTIVDDKLDAYLTLGAKQLEVTYKNDDPSRTTQLKAMVQNLLTADKMKEMGTILHQTLAQMGETNLAVPEITVKNNYLYGNANTTFFDKIFPVLMGFFVFFFVFLISGIALLRERTTGTLERLLATPIKRSELVMGYLVGYGLLAIVQTLLIVLFSIYVLGIEFAGNLGWVLVINILLALTALVMGIFVSTFASSEFQMIQFIPIVVVPQVFFSGLIPLDTMSGWVRGLGYIFPLSYAGDALTNVMIKGQGWSNIWPQLLVLIGFIIGFMMINILGLKRYRKV